MSGDAADRKDDDLLSQIDELKARMDRLMSGGTSTSNSALLTDAPRASAPVVEAKPTPTPPPPRKRVGDLLGDSGSDSLDELAKRDAVVFPDESSSAAEKRTPDRPDDRPTSNPPPNKPPSADGSLITVDESRDDPRPKVESFDDLGSAVEQELARDSSVPPVFTRKGPDLASRFGPSDEPAEQSQDAEDQEDAAPAAVVEPEDIEEIEYREVESAPKGNRRIGTVVVIWVFTAAASCGIAVLHFTGVI